MPMIRRSGTTERLGERGVALPLALLGLVVVSLLVTAALLASSTEMATSQASTDGTRALYRAESAVDEYLRGVDDAHLSLGDHLGARTFSTSAGGQVRLTTTRLGQIPVSGGGTERIYSILSEPMEGGVPRGRSVIAMVRQQVSPPITLDTKINSAIALGGDLHVNGNAFTVSGRRQASDTCATHSVDAVHRSADSEISTNNQNHMKNFVGGDTLGNNTQSWNSIKTFDKNRQQLAYDALGLPAGQTLEDLIAGIPDSKKFGPRFGTPVSRFDGVVDHTDKVAVIDANGGVVELKGDSGVVIVVNGHIQMKGNSKFKGIIIVEGNFNLSGNPNVNGAIVSLGIRETAEGNIINLDENALGNGNVTVQFNRCSILAAERALREASLEAAHTRTAAPAAWFEVVR